MYINRILFPRSRRKKNTVKQSYKYRHHFDGILPLRNCLQPTVHLIGSLESIYYEYLSILYVILRCGIFGLMRIYDVSCLLIFIYV